VVQKTARAGVPAFSINTALKFAGHPAQWGKVRHPAR
jgi:hypothetical protein